jgi:hypothetical protein
LASEPVLTGSRTCAVLLANGLLKGLPPKRDMSDEQALSESAAMATPDNRSAERATEIEDAKFFCRRIATPELTQL